MPKFQPASQDNGKFETIYSLKLNEKMAAAYKRLERSEVCPFPSRGPPP